MTSKKSKGKGKGTFKDEPEYKDYQAWKKERANGNVPSSQPDYKIKVVGTYTRVYFLSRPSEDLHLRMTSQGWNRKHIGKDWYYRFSNVFTKAEVREVVGYGTQHPITTEKYEYRPNK